VAQTFLLRLLTPYKSLLEDQVEAVIVPGENGQFGVLPRHTKYVTTLVPGVLRYVMGGQTNILAISGGFAEVYPDGVTVLADSMETPGEIDAKRAQESKERALKELARKGELSEREIARWEDRLARSENRLKMAKSG
jgi:F-type H+-transporting ATPase subunit epsilon